jgi:murein DD-endopeptidase MepM/ murein hydrolase activator NlpD
VTNDPTTSLGGQNAAAGAAAPAMTPGLASDAERQQIKQLAQEFEALLMTQMLREMRRSMLSDEPPEGGLGSDVMTDTIDVELGRALSRVGGFGLSGVMLSALERRVGAGTLPTEGRTQAPVERPVVTAPPIPAAAPAQTPVIPASREGEFKVPDGPVSSGFGWRRDPFTGETRFHRGIDVAQPYGRDVSVAASGTVVFAGERGTYGTMVVVEHASGQQTRYAHLSESAVRVGEAVETGQVIGKAGNSGRSTGSHLHFEVVAFGQAVDPATGH